MQRKRHAIALLVALGLGFAGLTAHPPATSAQDAGSLIIAVSTCPEGYDGGDYATDCATPAAGIDFVIATPNTGNVETTTSRADGLATFSLAPFDLNPDAPDRVSVGEPAAQALDYAVICTKNDGEPLDFAYETIDAEPGGPLFGISFEVETGEHVACEWYNIPQPMVPGDDGGAPGGQVGQLPNTGAGGDTTGDGAPFRDLPHAAVLLILVGGAVHGLRRRVAA